MPRPTDRKTTQLRALLARPDLAFLMEAHSALAARIAVEAGFEGVWASGLCMASALGVRDANEASWTQVLEVAEFMTDACRAPILFDGDSGFGNFNAVRRLVNKLEQRGIAGVCIEDQPCPKMNSLRAAHNGPRTLADVDEFCGKIKAGKDAQRDDDFVLVARVEAFIAGRGLGEALRRADAYRAAGADAILIHSNRPTADEVLSFKQEWGARSPVVIVPTTYGQTPTDVFAAHGFSLVIWANHLLRASLAAMQSAAAQIFAERSAAAVEPRLANIGEVFRLQDQEELDAAERRYLPERAP